MRFSKWWKPPEPRRPAPAVPDGRRIYAVGDIHGRADLLNRMADLVAGDLAHHPAGEATTIFLGDYVDRGPDSRAVLDRLARRDFPTPIVTLRGNHEDILIGFLSGEVDAGYYQQIGGATTLTSYGVDLRAFARASPALRAAMLDIAIPDSHCAFLDQLRLTETVGDYFFCHAGVRPGVPLDRQNPEDLLWIRDEFLDSEADLGRIVVHGHTPVREPHIRSNAINIDTQAFASGVLTGLVLEGTAMRFLRAG